MAADAAVDGIREVDTDGSVGLIGSEEDPPYDRPPLSKGLWGKTSEDDIWRGRADRVSDLHLGRWTTTEGSAPWRMKEVTSSSSGVGSSGVSSRPPLPGQAVRSPSCSRRRNCPPASFPPSLSYFVSDYFRDRGVKANSKLRMGKTWRRDDGVTAPIAGFSGRSPLAAGRPHQSVSCPSRLRRAAFSSPPSAGSRVGLSRTLLRRPARRRRGTPPRPGAIPPGIGSEACARRTFAPPRTRR